MLKVWTVDTATAAGRMTDASCLCAENRSHMFPGRCPVLAITFTKLISSVITQLLSKLNQALS